MKGRRQFLSVICGVVVLGLMSLSLVQAETTSVRRRDSCSILRVPVAEKLLGGTIAKVERSQGLDRWQVCSAFGKSPTARLVQLAIAPANPISGSLTAEFCNRYSESRKVAFWTDSVNWIPKLGLKAFSAAESGLYVYTGSWLFKVYVSAPQPQRSQEVEAEGITLNDAKAAVELARAILRTVPTHTHAPRPHCQ